MQASDEKQLTDACMSGRHLEKKQAEEKEKEKQERRRKERQNRDAFKELLDRHIKEGVLVAHMRWAVSSLYNTIFTSLSDSFE
jgi:glycerol dehydrogenase-like iron-containing ADH family enzyme